jgi:hypothetical protein
MFGVRQLMRSLALDIDSIVRGKLRQIAADRGGLRQFAAVRGNFRLYPANIWCAALSGGTWRYPASAPL